MIVKPRRTAAFALPWSSPGRFVPSSEEMDVAAVAEALGGTPSPEPAVLLRLRLMAVDTETAEQRLVGSFVRPLAMPLALARPDVEIAVEIRGQRRVFKPTAITWDETHRACILEVTWLVGDDEACDPDAVAHDPPWAL